MGDIAEGIFLEVLPLGPAVRVGLRRPDVALNLASPFLLHTPDFYTSSGWLVEVMGVGRDATVKLKESKYDSLLEWNKKQRVALFVWDSAQRRWLLTPIDAVKRIASAMRRRGDISAFENDGNTYFAIPWDQLASDDDALVDDAAA